MKAYGENPAQDFHYVLKSFDWASLGSAKVVDIGGSRGHIAISLARVLPNISVVVQDMAHVVEGADSEVPVELQKRISFQAHDFFQPQGVIADVYYIRWVLHNWPDKHSIDILRAQIPVLKPGSRILIQDVFMPEPGEVPHCKERDIRLVCRSTALSLKPGVFCREKIRQ